tara:strand:+ start:4844 stop:6193 length:1350 start_codon:yes stop_codon:yes gene_type:complete
MNKEGIIILGANPISELLIARLNMQGFKLTVIDIDSPYFTLIQSRYDVQAITGHPSHPDILALAQNDDTAMLIAVTEHDETNILACQIGHSVLRIPTLIASISSPSYHDADKIFGENQKAITHLVNHDESIFKDIEHLVRQPRYKLVWPISQGFVATTLAINSSHEFYQQSLAEIIPNLPSKTIIAGLFRHGEWVKFRKNIKIANKDVLLFITRDHQLPMLTSHLKPVTNILLLGISSFTYAICRYLQTNYSITVIEPNIQKCEELSQNYPHIKIINNDPQEQKTLKDYQIEQSLVIAASSDDEDNLIYSFHAHDCQAPHLLTVINRIRQGHIFEHSPIDYTILTPQIITDEIIRNILAPKNVQYFYTRTNQLQLADIKIHAEHPFSNQSLQYIKSHYHFHIGAILREGQVLFTTKELTVQPGDHLILYSSHSQETPPYLEKVLFQLKL